MGKPVKRHGCFAPRGEIAQPLVTQAKGQLWPWADKGGGQEETGMDAVTLQFWFNSALLPQHHDTTYPEALRRHVILLQGDTPTPRLRVFVRPRFS
jgi:hypothetical protein